MLSTSQIRDLNYYANLASEDYYHAGGEPPGQWAGSGSADFGLHGRVSDLAYRRIFAGMDPLTAHPLLQQQVGKDHRPGWDFTFSAPKSVSVVWSQADERTRQDIQHAQDVAVRAAIQHLEKYAVTRRGHGGTEHEPARLIVATYEHGTSRAQDPQLHTHSLVANLCRREDGTFGTLEVRDMYSAKMAAGAIYRAELAARMQALGYAVEQDGEAFRIAGSSRALENEFSKRREEIERTLEEKKLSGARAAEVACLDTRHKKSELNRGDLFAVWQQTGQEYGYDETAVRAAVADPIPEIPPAADIMRTLTENLSVTTEHQIYRTVGVAALGRLDAAGIEAQVQEILAGPDVVRLRRNDGQIRYSTREMVEIEAGLGASAVGRKGEGKHPVAVDHIAAACSRSTPSEQQRAVIEQIVGGADGVVCVQGMAGAGKSYVLGICREAWESAGYQVQGAALAGKAAAGLTDEAQIESHTIHRLLADLADGRQQLTARTIVVIDEAGMVGSRQMAEILSRCEEAGAKLVLAGDTDQLQPVSAGGAFRAIQERTGALVINEIRRQRNAEDRLQTGAPTGRWAINAVHDFAAGRAAEGLAAYHAQGRLHVEADRQVTMSRLIDAWADQRDRRSPEESLILGSLNHDVAELNRKAREHVRPTLGAGGVITVADRAGNTRPLEIREGDRICFGKNANVFDPSAKTKQPVKNGHLATVEFMQPGKQPGEWLITAKIDGDPPRSVRFSSVEYNQLAHGYAVTSYKAQGVTVDRTYVFAADTMASRENIYVQMSRHRLSADLFISAPDFDCLIKEKVIKNKHLKKIETKNKKEIEIQTVDNKLSSIRELTKKLSKSIKKETTLDYFVID